MPRTGRAGYMKQYYVLHPEAYQANIKLAKDKRVARTIYNKLQNITDDAVLKGLQAVVINLTPVQKEELIRRITEMPCAVNMV